MSTAQRNLLIVLSVVCTLVLFTAWSPVLGSGDDDDELDRKLDGLAARVASIERRLGSKADDSAKPSIAERVATLEKGLGELSRAAGRPKWSSPGSNLRELKRSLESAERQRNEIAGRLGRLEGDLRDAANCARELRSIRTTFDSLRRDLRDLENRVRRLESRP